MPDNSINAHITLRYDTYRNWMIKNPVLQAGEVAIVVWAETYTIGLTDHIPDQTPPAVGMKVGDGTRRFSGLPWLQGIAGDVYSWAKAATKPTYTANEISGLAAFVDDEITANPSPMLLYDFLQEATTTSLRYYLRYRPTNSEIWTTNTSSYIDLTDLQTIYNWIGSNLITTYKDYGGLVGYNQNAFVSLKDHYLNYTDTAVSGSFVTAVSETGGIISVTRKALAFSDINETLTIAQGGTGVSTLPINQVLIGHGTDAITGISIDTEVNNNNNLVYNYAVKAYIDAKTAGLSGAMHFRGISSVDLSIQENIAADPLINNYDFSKVEQGDVVFYSYKEFVWGGESWHEFGSEGSYALKGSITNADIAADAGIVQSKIAGLSDALNSKVDKVTGKGLSTHDYSDADYNKLLNIEAGAQVNVIEHILVNGTEQLPMRLNDMEHVVSINLDTIYATQLTKLNNIEAGAQVNTIEHIFVNGVLQPITTVNELEKSANITFKGLTDEQEEKLDSIEAGAQVNTVTRYFIGETEVFPNANKELHVNITESMLDIDLLQGAQVPGTIAGVLEDVAISEANYLQFARVAKTGNIKDLIQSPTEYITISCGSSTEVM